MDWGLPVKLPSIENSMADLRGRLEDLEAQIKDEMADKDAKIKDLEAQIDALKQLDDQ